MFPLRRPLALPRTATTAFRGIPRRTLSNSAPDTFALAEVDVSALFVHEPRPEDVGRVARTLSKAAKQLGFLYLSGSPISPLIPNVFHAADWVFSLPPAVKSSIETPNAQRGYHSFRGAPASLLSSSTAPASPHAPHVPDSPETGECSAVVGQADSIEAFTVQNDDIPQQGLRGKYDHLALLEPHELLTHVSAASHSDDIDDDNDFDDEGAFPSQIPGFSPPISGFAVPTSTAFAPPLGRAATPAFVPPTSATVGGFVPPTSAAGVKASSNSTRQFYKPLSLDAVSATSQTHRGYNRWPAPLPSLPPYPSPSATSASESSPSSPSESFRSALRAYYSACARTGDAVSAALAGGLTFPPEARDEDVGAAVLAAVRGHVEGTETVGMEEAERAVREVVGSHKRQGHTLEIKKYPKTTADDARARKGLPLAALDVAAAEGSGGAAVKEGEEVALRMPVHSDLSTLTFLVQSHDKGGLLLRDKNTGRWLRAPQRGGRVLVNTGDFFRDWSRGVLPSTLHCVAAVDASSTVTTSDEQARVSTVFFYQPDMDAVIRPLPLPATAATDGDDQGPVMEEFPPFLAGDRYPFFCS